MRANPIFSESKQERVSAIVHTEDPTKWLATRFDRQRIWCWDPIEIFNGDETLDELPGISLWMDDKISWRQVATIGAVGALR